MADHAFPELHGGRAAKKEPENLLILTRTTTDRHGRRHSVAVPLIPPPDGEKFEGGYHVERNPLTGGAKLVPPPGGSTKTRTRSISEKRGHSRPSMKVTKPQAPASPAKNNGKSKGSSKSTGSAGSGKDLLSIPAAAGGAGKRRHSYQSGVPGLAKDMDRLRVSAAAANAGGNQGSGQGRSPRGSTRRRASSARRSSRSGFLHFLDLAIAN